MTPITNLEKAEKLFYANKLLLADTILGDRLEIAQILTSDMEFRVTFIMDGHINDFVRFTYDPETFELTPIGVGKNLILIEGVVEENLVAINMKTHEIRSVDSQQGNGNHWVTLSSYQSWEHYSQYSSYVFGDLKDLPYSVQSKLRNKLYAGG